MQRQTIEQLDKEEKQEQERREATEASLQAEADRQQEAVQSLLRSEGWAVARSYLDRLIEDAQKALLSESSDNLRNYGFYQGRLLALSDFNNGLIDIADGPQEEVYDNE